MDWKQERRWVWVGATRGSTDLHFLPEQGWYQYTKLKLTRTFLDCDKWVMEVGNRCSGKAKARYKYFPLRWGINENVVRYEEGERRCEGAGLGEMRGCVINPKLRKTRIVWGQDNVNDQVHNMVVKFWQVRSNLSSAMVFPANGLRRLQWMLLYSLPTQRRRLPLAHADFVACRFFDKIHCDREAPCTRLDIHPPGNKLAYNQLLDTTCTFNIEKLLLAYRYQRSLPVHS